MKYICLILRLFNSPSISSKKMFPSGRKKFTTRVKRFGKRIKNVVGRLALIEPDQEIYGAKMTQLLGPKIKLVRYILL